MKTKSSNAIELLIQDHQEVKSLFKQFEALNDGSLASKKKIVTQICNSLIVHTHIEEAILYPTVREVIKADALLNEAIVEHDSAKELIAQLLEMDGTEDLYDAKVKVLSEQIEHHIREEEEDLFPKISKTQIDLEALGVEMQALKNEFETVPA